MNPFENNERFAALSEEAKGIVLQKYHALSDEAKQIVTSRLGAPPAAPVEDPAITKQRELVTGLKSQGIDAATVKAQEQKLGMMEKGIPNEQRPFSLQESPFATTGQNIAEGLAKKGFDPYLSAAAGTAFTMLPDIATSLPIGGGVAKAPAGVKAAVKAVGKTEIGQALKGAGALEVERLLTEQAKNTLASTTKKETLGLAIQKSKDAAASIGEGLKSAAERELGSLSEQKLALELAKEKAVGGARQAADKVSGIAKETLAKVKTEAEAPIAAIKERLKELPLQQRKVLEGAKSTVLEAKAAIQAAEKELGIGLDKIGSSKFQHLIKNPQKFAAKYVEIANKYGVDGLAEAFDVETLQTIRKAAENASSNPINKAFKVELRQVETAFRNAIGKSSKMFDDAISNFKTASQSLDSIPNDFKAKKETLQLGLQKMQELAKQKVATNESAARLSKMSEVLERNAKEVGSQYAQKIAALNLRISKAKTAASEAAASSPKLAQLKRNIPIMEQKLSEITAQSKIISQKLDIAIQEAKQLAAKQTSLRAIAGKTGAAIGLSAAGVFGAKLVNKMSGGRRD